MSHSCQKLIVNKNIDKTSKKKKYAYIDAIKGLAIIAIVLYHLQVVEGYKIPELLKSVINQGARGVQLFFIISALTLCMSLSKQIKEGKHFWLNYLTRRFFRIAPVFYLIVLLNYFIFHINPADYIPAHIPFSVGLLISSITFINGLNPYWMGTTVPGGWIITVTVMFYLLLPFIMRKITNLLSTFKLLAISLILWNIVIFVITRFPSLNSQAVMRFYISAFIITQLPVFICGIVLFHVIRDHYDLDNMKPWSGILLFFSLLVYLSLEKVIYVLPTHFLPSVALTVFIYSQCLHPSKLIVNKFFIFIGKISYSIFLTHFFVILYMSKYINFTIEINPIFNLIAHFGVLIVLSIAISIIVHYFIEIPGVRIGEKIAGFISKV